MNDIFIFKETEDNIKYYYTSDDEFHVIERPDGFFLLYQLNLKDDCYDWTETYHDSMEDCIKEMNEILTEQHR